jgi:hypothetical protein
MNRKAQTCEGYTCNPVFSTFEAGLLLFGKKKKDPKPTDINSPEKTEPQKKVRPKGLKVDRAEIVQDKLKFYVEKGLFKKHSLVIREFPIAEVLEPESSENWISFKSNGSAYAFLLKQKADSFSKLFEQLQTALEKQKKESEHKEKAALRKTEILALLNCVRSTVDTSFDVLTSLHEKRANWSQIEGLIQGWVLPLNFKAQTLLPLDLDYSKVTAAIKSQNAIETAKETLAILKKVHAYFTDLKPEEDIADSAPNFDQAKEIILAYYTLNDLFLAKVVNDNDSAHEIEYLETNLKALSDTTDFKLDLSELMTTVDSAGVLGDASGARGMFWEKLSSFR